MNKKMNKKGFTIVELVIVIAVIAILAAVMIPTFGGIIKTANESSVSQTASAIYKQVYALDLSDGVIDGQKNKVAIGVVEGVAQGDANTADTTTHYEYTFTDGAFTEFVYRDATKKITSTFNGTTWTTVSDT